MTPDRDGSPMIDASARTLGARPSIDVPGDAADYVEPAAGGMSASIGDPEHLPLHRRPAAFGGSGADPVFSIDVSDLGEDLRWRADPDGPLGHGLLEPVRRMPFNEYQEALWATRARWRRVDA
jgi:hypothetical protein